MIYNFSILICVAPVLALIGLAAGFFLWAIMIGYVFLISLFKNMPSIIDSIKEKQIFKINP